MNDQSANLELVSTEELVDELRRRSRVFFVCMRPMADDAEHAWSWAWAVDGLVGVAAEARTIEERNVARERVMGLIDRAKFDMIYQQPNLDDLV